MTWRKLLPSVALMCCVLLLVLSPGIGLGDDPPEEPLTSPVIPGGIPSHREISCPPGYIANRVAYGGRRHTLRDEIRVEVCVTRDSGIDTYAYLVTNLGYVVHEGTSREAGIGRFDAPDHLGQEIVAATGPPGWTYVGYVDGLAAHGWDMPIGDAGIEIGESEIFTVSYAGPTGPGAGWASILLDVDVDHVEASSLDPAVVVQSLGPVTVLPEVPPLTECPEGYVAYDVGYGTAVRPPSPGFGQVRVEECVTREGSVDTYTYTVTNLSYYFCPWGAPLHFPLGIADFTVPNPAGLEPISVSSPPHWAFDSTATDEWHWSVESTWWGSTTHGRLALGDSAIFSFSVEGPTEDGPLEVRVQAQSALLPEYLWDDLGFTDGVTVMSTGPHRQRLDRGAGSGLVTEPIPLLAACPEGSVAYDVGYGTDSSFGEIRVEECVTREGDVDTYTYTVTNLSYVYPHEGERYGIGDFAVPISFGVIPLSVTTPAGWAFDSTATDEWHWSLPSGSIGIWPGNSAVFAFSVAGPTEDGALEVRAMPQFPRSPVPTYYTDDFTVLTLSTGPQPRLDPLPGLGVLPSTGEPENLPPPEKCPDLMIDSVELGCECGWTPQQQYRCDVEAEVWVRNSGEADAGIFWVELITDEGDKRKMIASLAAGQSRRVELSLDSIQVACPLNIMIKVDPHNFVAECDEGNNTHSEELCCQ